MTIRKIPAYAFGISLALAGACCQQQNEPFHHRSRAHQATRPIRAEEIELKALHKRNGQLEEKCQKGDPKSCRELARELDLGVSGPTNRFRAQNLLRNQCNQGIRKACRALAVMKPLISYPGPGNWAAAMKIYTAACRQGDLDACEIWPKVLGRRDGYSSGAWKVKNRAEQGCRAGNAESCLWHGLAMFGFVHEHGARGNRVKNWLHLACQKNIPVACALVAEIHLMGFKTPKNPQRAEKLYLKACRAGVPAACTRWGRWLISAKNPHPEQQKARLVFARACAGTGMLPSLNVRLRDPNGCVELARLQQQGRGGSKNLNKALQLAQAACRQELASGCLLLAEMKCRRGDGDMLACVEAGRRRQLGRPGNPDPSKALALFQKACRAGNPRGCAYLALVLERDNPLLNSAGDKNEHFAKCCHKNDPLACLVAGLVYHRYAWGADTNAKRTGFLKKACQWGNGTACHLVAEVYRFGQSGVKKDTEAQLTYLKKACRLNHFTSCRQLAGPLSMSKKINELRRGRKLLKKSCDGGVLYACYQLSRMLMAGWGGPKNRAAGLSILRKTCDGGLQYACENWLRHQLKPSQLAKDTFKIVLTRCSAGDMALCRHAGQHLMNRGFQEHKDPQRRSNGPIGIEKIRRLFRKACRHGDGRGCQELAHTHIYSDGDPLVRRHYHMRACMAHSRDGCHEISQEYLYGRVLPPRPLRARLWALRDCHRSGQACSVAHQALQKYLARSKDMALARTLRRKACQTGVLRACRELAAMLRRGRGGPQKPKEAQQLLSVSCRKGDGQSCFLAALPLEFGPRTQSGAKKARALYKRGCHLDDMESCAHLAFMSEDGRGGKRSLDSTFETLSRICRKGVTAACHHHARLLENSPSTQRQAAQIYQTACNRGDGLSCDMLAWMAVDGRGMNKDYRTAGRWFKQACAHGFFYACRNYKDSPQHGGTPIYVPADRFKVYPLR